MAGMKFNADIDLKSIVKLRQEIDKLKKSLIAVAGIPNSDAAIKQLEKEIAAATKKLEEYENKYLQIQKLKHDIDSSNDAVKKAKEETAALQSTNKWIVANTEAVIETDKQIKQLKKSFVALANSEKTGTSGIGILRQVQQLAAQRLVEEEAVRKTIKAQKDQIIQSKAEEGSITALRKQIILLTKDYDDLGRTRRNGDAGKALLAQIANVQKELSAAEQASGRFQRNVGNYASAWNGLGFSVQQVARELPSLAVSANTFFLAISNNLPILVDEIAKARKEYAAFKAELAAGNKDVKAVAPVWQQLTKSLISWQTALVVGLTLLSVYGKDVIKWIGSLGKARDVTLDLLSAEQEMALARKSAWSSIVKEQTQLDILYSKLKNVTLSTTERNAAVREWVKNYKTHSDILDGEKVSIDKLNKAYKELTKEIRNSAIARKYEDTLADMSIKREDEEIKRLNQKKTLYDAGLEMSVAQREYERVQREYDKGQTSSQVLSSARVRYLNAVDNWNKEKKVYVDAINTVKKYDENMAVIENHISTLDLFPQPKEGTYDYWQQQVEIADNALKQITSEQKKVLDEASKDSKKDLYGLGIDRAVVDSYKKAVKDKAEAEKQLKVYGDSSKEQKMAEKEAEKRKKEQEKLNEELLFLRRQNQQAEIDLMEEGAEKKLKQIDLDYQKELDAIKKQEKDLMEKQGEKLTQEQSIEISTRYTNAERKREKGISDTTREQLEAQKDAWNEYYIEYGKYQEKRMAIMEKYDKQIAKAEEGSAEKATLTAQRKKELDDLDKDLLDSSELWSKFFTDFSNRSSSSIRSIIEDIQELIDYMNGVEGAQIPDIFKDNEKAVKAINDAMSNPSALKKFTSNLESSIKKFKKMLDEDNPFKQISEGFKTKDSKGISKGFQGIASAAKELTGILEELGVESDSTAGKVTSVLGNTASYAATGASVGGPWGAIIGGAIGMATGLVGVLGADYSAYNKMKDEYASLIDVWDILINKKKEYVNISYGDEARKAGEEAIDILNKKSQAKIDLGIERLNSGASAGSHSIGVRIRKSMTQNEWNQWDEFARSIGMDPDAIGGRLTGLFSLTGKQLSKLQEEAPTFWAKLDDDVKGYLQDIIDCNEEIENMKEQLKETMTGVSFDSFYDNFVSTLSDMDKDSQDFADDFENYLKNAILSNLVANKYRSKIEALYNDWANKSDSNGDGIFDLTSSEADELRKAQQALAEEMIAERDAMAEVFGWTSSASSQESSKKGFATMSQDSADELNGRFTALQISGEEIKNQNQLQTMSILDLKAGMLSIGANTSGIKDIASETRDLIRLSYEAITDIRDNTNVMVKPIQQMAADIAEVKRNTNGLSKK